MWKFLLDNWITILLGLAGVGATLYVYLRSKQNKKLSIELLSNAQLLSVSKDIAPDLTINYKGVSITQELSAILLRVANTGNVPITVADFYRPLSFQMSELAEILSAGISDVIPSNLEPFIEVQKPNAATIRPLLLNPGDKFVVRFVVLNNDRTINANARIQGVSTVLVDTVGKVGKSSSLSRIARFFE